MTHLRFQTELVERRLKEDDQLVFRGFDEAQCHIVYRRGEEETEIYDASEVISPSDSPDLRVDKYTVLILTVGSHLCKERNLRLESQGIFDKEGALIADGQLHGNAHEVRYRIAR